ncbi:hypothetical protein SKAU_G00316390 [Synaphobranchus kaupii]|uniref:Uncharacterized protein n=1 Tax=Synaphobranchus kaupii TaxID=118154 RepID=A0A9Q1ESN7_SYNKA|nr:hypothetical protein SKAU_G00316390 [Synaphobranchus kaupii]
MQQKVLLEVMEEVKVLKRLIMEKDKKIDHLEKRVANLEQYTRISDEQDLNKGEVAVDDFGGSGDNPLHIVFVVAAGAPYQTVMAEVRMLWMMAE